MEYLLRFLKKYWFLIILAVMVFLFVYNVTNKETLSVYNTSVGNSTYTVTTEAETEETVASFTYSNSALAMTMEIPEGWEYVLKDGYDTYVHSASASSVQIQVLSYYPMVNNVSSDSLSETYAGYGYTLTEFGFMSNCSYYVIYQASTSSGSVTDYIEEVFWDRSHVLKVVMCFDDSNYDRLQNEIWNSLNSIYWEQEDPVPLDLFLTYFSNGDFEFAVPMDWVIGSTDSSYYAYDETDGSSMTVYVLEDSTSVGDISQIDYANYLSNGVDDFILTQFNATDEYLYGEASYTSNGTSMYAVQYYFANGVYNYILTWECPYSIAETVVPVAREALALTRIFYVVDTSTETEETSDSVYVPDDLGISSSTSSSESETAAYSSESEAISSAGSDLLNGTDDTQYSLETQTEAQTEENVATFADALVTVAGITSEQAEEISSVWNSLGLESPTYAEAYMQTDTYLIIYVSGAYGTEYYIYLYLSGDLAGINVGNVDGETIYLQ